MFVLPVALGAFYILFLVGGILVSELWLGQVWPTWPKNGQHWTEHEPPKSVNVQ